MEEAIDGEFMGDIPKDHAQIIIRRKRTQRPRPLSPIPISTVPFATLYSSRDGDNNINAAATSTSSTSTESVVTDEEEDVANCLFLLSQGPPKFDVDDHEKNVTKFTSKRYLETPWMGGGGKAGTYVYQCKTCDRTFSSFQALGGHRVSHTRTKPDRGTGHYNDHEEQMRRQYMPPSLSLQGNNNPKASSKVHECLICGVEFSSGQALGGHMRRHRASIGANTSFSSSSSPIGYEFVDPEAKKARIVLPLDLGLDLNLPAPEDRVHLQPSKVGFTPKQQEQQQQQQQQSPIGTLSVAPALGDCHY